MTFRSITLAALLAALAAPAAFAGSTHTNRNQVLEEMYQVRTGDYSYQVDHDGRRIPRYGYYGRYEGDAHGYYEGDAPPAEIVIKPRRRRR